jgi:hypothetical protein
MVQVQLYYSMSHYTWQSAYTWQLFLRDAAPPARTTMIPQQPQCMMEEISSDVIHRIIELPIMESLLSLTT